MLESCTLCCFFDPLTPKIRLLILPYSCYIFCVNHKTELIDFNRRILNHKLLTVTEQNGTATLSKTQRVHNESKFQHGGSLVQSSTFFLTVSAHVPHAHRRLIGWRSKLLVCRFHIFPCKLVMRIWYLDQDNNLCLISLCILNSC